MSWVWALMLAVGIVLGTIGDEHPARPVVMRGPWRVLQADFHAHSRFSDGFLSPPELVMQASRRGLDVLAVTEHNLLFPAELARWWSELVGGPTIILGEEITTSRWHLHGIGLTERISPSLLLSDAIDEIHRQGGLAIAAHPVERFWPAFDPVITKLDGAELMHPIALRPSRSRSGWSGAGLVHFFERAAQRGKRLTAIGSSDYHFGAPLGLPRTYVFAKSDSATDVMDALRAGRTVVALFGGELAGDPESVAALKAEPMPAPPPIDKTSTGPLDTIGRVLGLVGLVGLVLFRRRRAVSRAAA